ncbi:SagB/ThcOx family dehydrogenase [Candidatus Thorarchaeota archaeon]|nr:MAG: SagB/ThcOx family dehydrogenase [Candidatus Thorarchaeota archaeon]
MKHRIYYTMTSGYGEDFLKNSKYVRGKLPQHALDWSKMPAQYKTYDDAERISLPKPVVQDGPDIWKVIWKRRSIRAYTDDTMSLADLSQILWATQGVRETVSGANCDFKLRTSPSAGALYPIETYLYVNRVDGLKQGLYHYVIGDHKLELIKEGDFSREVRGGALDQQIAGNAAVVFIWTAIIERSSWKYLQRAYRYIFLDAGHIAQNLALAVEALDYGSCQVGAIYDDEINSLLDLDGVDETVVYMSTVARPRRIP